MVQREQTDTPKPPDPPRNQGEELQEYNDRKQALEDEWRDLNMDRRNLRYEGKLLSFTPDKQAELDAYTADSIPVPTPWYWADSGPEMFHTVPLRHCKPFENWVSIFRFAPV